MNFNNSSILYFCRIALINLLLFIAAYGTANHFATFGQTNKIYFDWEPNIALIDWMIVPYLSLIFLFLPHMFILNKDEARRLGMAFSFCTISAFSVFMIYPCQLGFERQIPAGNFAEIYDAVFLIDQPHNLFPSLHVSFAMLYLISIFSKLKLIWRTLFSGWILVVIASTFFTHQHHIIDIISGLILAVVAAKLTLYDSFWQRCCFKIGTRPFPEA
jgi:membrane-associated phospholipid phosphatase